MENNEVLAKVGNKEITNKDVELIIKNLDPQTAMQFYSKSGRKRLVDELVNQELFYLDAKDNKLDSEEGFKAELERIKSNILVQYSINKFLGNINVNAEEIKDYYIQNKEQFKAPEMVNSSHILVDDENEANKVLNELKEGTSFEEAAEKYSKCPSKSQGGNLGYNSRGKLVPEFEAAAFSMKKDEISQPVKTQFGYHIIKVIDKKQEAEKSFDEVKDQIAQQLVSKKQEDAFQGKVNELKGKYKVEINL